MTESHAYYGVGKSILNYETSLFKAGENFQNGARDYSKIFREAEEERVKYDTVWNLMTIINTVTDKIRTMAYYRLNRRINKANVAKLDSDLILQALTELKENGKLSDEELSSVNRWIHQYKLQGSELDEKKKDFLRGKCNSNLVQVLFDYNARMHQCTNRFRQNIGDIAVMRDFPTDVLKAMSSDSSQPSKGPWTVTLHPYIYHKFMEYCPSRKMRWNVYLADVSRGSPEFDQMMDVNAQLKRIRSVRMSIAMTLGYDHYIDMQLDNNKMAGKLENVQNMISSLLPAARSGQEKELESLQRFAEKRGFEDDLANYDLAYFKRKQRKSFLGNLFFLFTRPSGENSKSEILSSSVADG